MLTYDALIHRLIRIGGYFVIGRSECGYAIPGIKVGGGRPVVIVTGGIHARENVSAELVLRQAEYAAKRGIFGGTAYFLPMLNPDGALIVEKGAAAFPWLSKRLTALNGGNDDFTLWKANAHGVDLNVNFDARWGMGQSNVFDPAPENYVGACPAGAAETQALIDFTRKIRPDFTVSYHAKGRELYWYFHQPSAVFRRDYVLASLIAARLKYRLGAAHTSSAGGYKDWCVDKLKIPGVTVEIGRDEYSHPLGEAIVDEEWELNRDIPQYCIRLLREIYTN